MDTRQIRENITEIEANRLLELYDYYSKNFNPVDYEMCDTYEEIKAEILRRLEKH